ncbi:MAG: dienelactone hydrolase family protein [Pirellulaceae bacterium]|nr:dienelactone hydrolase family protein [Pirellulaceae bacterium]
MTRDRRLRIHAGGRARRVLVHLPPGFDGQRAMPVVIMLHGGGGTGRSAAIETGWCDHADRAGFLAVFPNALSRNPDEPSSFPGNPQLWNDGSRRFHSSRETPDDIGFLAALLDELQTQFAIDPERVFVTGFSNGASMAFRAGAELAERIAAVAPVAGTCWLDHIDLCQPVSLCYITGTEDPLNPIEGGLTKLVFESGEQFRPRPKPPVRDSIRKWVEAIGCSQDAARIAEIDGVRTEWFGPGRGGANVAYVTVKGLGHNWAGGRSLLPESIAGNRSDKLRATDLIWDFFQQTRP